MARLSESREQSDSDDAPESFTLVQSKKNIKKQDKKLQEYQVSQTAKIKSRNRDRDRKLKERALVTRVLGKTGVKESNRDVENDVAMQGRMARAMQDALDEAEGDGMVEISEGEQENSENAEDGGDQSMFDGQSENGSERHSEDADDEYVTVFSDPQAKGKPNPNYLEDELFTATFASQSASHELKEKYNSLSLSSQKVKAKKRRSKLRSRAKEQVIGSRTVRMLPKMADSASQASSLTIPSRKAKKFAESNLCLKGNLRSTKTWERKKANIGIMKRSDGPPASFVRSS